MHSFKNLIRLILLENQNEGGFLTKSKLDSEVLSALASNKTVGITFFRKDGTLRTIALRKFLSKYIRKTDGSSRTEEQKETLMIGYDTNLYIKYYKEILADIINEYDDVEEAKRQARTIASNGGTVNGKKYISPYRRISYNSIVAISVGGKVFPYYEINDILGRYGVENLEEAKRMAKISPEIKPSTLESNDRQIDELFTNNENVNENINQKKNLMNVNRKLTRKR
jgi:hypothetical protein